jgi:hypothetical protein
MALIKSIWGWDTFGRGQCQLKSQQHPFWSVWHWKILTCTYVWSNEGAHQVVRANCMMRCVSIAISMMDEWPPSQGPPPELQAKERRCFLCLGTFWRWSLAGGCASDINWLTSLWCDTMRHDMAWLNENEACSLQGLLPVSAGGPVLGKDALSVSRLQTDERTKFVRVLGTAARWFTDCARLCAKIKAMIAEHKTRCGNVTVGHAQWQPAWAHDTVVTFRRLRLEFQQGWQPIPLKHCMRSGHRLELGQLLGGFYFASWGPKYPRHAHMHAHIHKHICTRTYVPTYIHACRFIHTFVHVQSHNPACVRKYTHNN